MKSVLSLILVICTAAMGFTAFAESTPMGDMPSDIGQPPEGMGEPPEGMPGEPPEGMGNPPDGAAGPGGDDER